jgi:hypothetical protein
MMESLSPVDTVLLNRWTDAVSFREAMLDLEDRLGARLEAAAESLRPWLDEQGYGFLEIEQKYASINIARSGWLNKKKQQPWVWFALGALLPYGYRKVEEEHPFVWVVTQDLEKDDRTTFQEHLGNRLRGKEGLWVNEDCSREYPAGRYILSHGDSQRLALALAPETLVSFAREALAPILALGDDVQAALLATLGK